MTGPDPSLPSRRARSLTTVPGARLAVKLQELLSTGDGLAIGLYQDIAALEPDFSCGRIRLDLGYFRPASTRHAARPRLLAGKVAQFHAEIARLGRCWQCLRLGRPSRWSMQNTASAARHRRVTVPKVMPVSPPEANPQIVMQCTDWEPGYNPALMRRNGGEAMRWCPVQAGGSRTGDDRIRPLFVRAQRFQVPACGALPPQEEWLRHPYMEWVSGLDRSGKINVAHG